MTSNTIEKNIIICKNGVERVPKREHHHKRKRIIEENLMEYIDVVKISDRNKDIVRMYVAGAPYKEICEKYNINRQTASDVVARFIHHAHINKEKKL